MRGCSFVVFLSLMAFSSLIPGTGASALASSQGKAPPVITSKDKAGREYKTVGYIPMKAGPNTKKFQASGKIAGGDLPPKVDIRKFMTKVEDQGETSSCVANAIAGSYEYWVRRDTKQDYDVSRLFVYYNARWRNGDQHADSGSVIQLAMQGLQEFGACAEDRWPFQKPLLLQKPDRDAYQEAAKTRIKEMNQVPNDLNAWKQALASGYPVVFGILLFESFDQANQRGGVVPMPSPAEAGRESHGGHAMTAVGYNDKEQVFIVRNSWGDKWGDNGYCYMPYNYIINDAFNGGDSWVFIPENPIESTEDIWFEDEEPVTDGGKGVDFVINPYTDEDYEDVVLTWWEEYEDDYNASMDEEYIQYVEYVETEQWELVEEFEYEEIVETWEQENPGEDSDLYVYDDPGSGEETDYIDETSIDEESSVEEVEEVIEEEEALDETSIQEEDTGAVEDETIEETEENVGDDTSSMPEESIEEEELDASGAEESVEEDAGAYDEPVEDESPDISEEQSADSGGDEGGGEETGGGEEADTGADDGGGDGGGEE